MDNIRITSTPYDDVFRTLLNDCSSLIIPVINEVFEETYSGKETIIFSPNEHFMNQQGGNEDERITDSSFKIVGKEIKKYHLESYITDMECCGNTGKPKWENIRLLMERNQISSVDAAYVGDTAGDSNSAAKAGIPFIFASYGYGAVDKKDLSIDHFADLLKLYK